MRLQHALTISVHRDPVISIQDSHVPTTFEICVKCNLINCLLELELIGTHGWRHHSMLEGCDKHFICGRKEKKIQDAHSANGSEALSGFFTGSRNMLQENGCCAVSGYLH